jgi:hypothetical protein
MPDSWTAVEAERSRILRRSPRWVICARSGSIYAVSRRCGKPICHCAKPDDPGHRPQVLLSRTVRGRTLAESFASPSAFHKAQTEVQEYQRWQRLCAGVRQHQ